MFQLDHKYIVIAEQWWKTLTEDQKNANILDCNGKHSGHAIIAYAMILYNNDPRSNDYRYLWDEQLGLLTIRWYKAKWECAWISKSNIIWSNYV